jgi:hypothetical protein
MQFMFPKNDRFSALHQYRRLPDILKSKSASTQKNFPFCIANRSLVQSGLDPNPPTPQRAFFLMLRRMAQRNFFAVQFFSPSENRFSAKRPRFERQSSF